MFRWTAKWSADSQTSSLTLWTRLFGPMSRPNHSNRRRSWNRLSPLNFRSRLNFQNQSYLTDQILPGHTPPSTYQSRWLHRPFQVQQMALDRRQRPVTSRTQVHSARRVRQGSSLDDASRPPPIVHNFRPTSHTGLTKRITRERGVGNPPGNHQRC